MSRARRRLPFSRIAFPEDQLTFLNDYAGKTSREIQKDKRFRALMKMAIPRTEYHYGRDMPLSQTVEALLDGDPLPIDIREGRYAMVASHGGPYLSGNGFLWFDIHDGIALGGVYFHPPMASPRLRWPSSRGNWRTRISR